MIMSFLQAAEAADTIVSSRLPGGVGTDLIEAGYDLKGFQIKAKSCDWGPMAGFICQLPFLNKAGYSKIGYNTSYIIDYLTALDSFSGRITEISEIETRLNEVKKLLPDESQIKALSSLQHELDLSKVLLTEVTGPLNLQQVEGAITLIEKLAIETAIETAINKSFATIDNAKAELATVKEKIFSIYNKKIGKVVKEYRAAEHQNAAWSGENTIPPGGNAPFMPLKRSFGADINSAIATVKTMNGVISANKFSASSTDTIVGVAVNNATAAKTEGTSTIKVDFMLKKDPTVPGSGETTLWKIYYKTITYRKQGNGPFVDAINVYTTSLADSEATSLILQAKIRGEKPLSQRPLLRPTRSNAKKHSLRASPGFMREMPPKKMPPGTIIR